MDFSLSLTIILVTFIISFFLFWHFYNQAKMKERKLFFERGAKVEDLIKSGKRFRFPWLKVGVLMIGIGVGLVICTSILVLGNRFVTNPATHFAIMAICIGISMLIANYINNGKSEA